MHGVHVIARVEWNEGVTIFRPQEEASHRVYHIYLHAGRKYV